MPEPLPISICMLTLNEEDRLRRWHPPEGFRAEWLVFDSGSQDRTVDLCREHGARVVPVEWEGFGKTRKRLFEAATQPWIFWLDADEVMTSELQEEMIRLFQSTPTKAAYAVNRIVRFQDQWIRHGDWFPDWNVRLFRADAWRMDDPARVHESLSIDGSIGRLQGLLEHHTYRDWNDQTQRSRRYARLWAEQRRDQGRTARTWTGHLRAFWCFLRSYLFRLGFLDGPLGFRIALANAREVYWKYRFLAESR